MFRRIWKVSLVLPPPRRWSAARCCGLQSSAALKATPAALCWGPEADITTSIAVVVAGSHKSTFWMAPDGGPKFHGPEVPGPKGVGQSLTGCRG